MSFLLDDVARALARPAPRRQALKLLGGLLAGGILGAVGIGRAAAQDDVEPALCGTVHCKKGQKCCSYDNCAPKQNTCCGLHSCPPGQKCCPNGPVPLCCQVCCTYKNGCC